MSFRSHSTIVVLIAASALYGCGGAQPKQTGEEDNFNALPTSTAAPSTDAPPSSGSDKGASKDSSDSGGLTEDQKAQMEIALRRGGEKAANCSSVVTGGPKGEGEVKVQFDGQKGRCVDVTVGPPFAGTPMEACIKRAFVGEIIVPFEGELEVPYTVKIGVKGDDKPKDAKDAKDAKDTKDKGKKK